MKVSISSNPAQSRQVRQQLANPDESLTYELGKAVQELPPLYTRLLAGTISVMVFGTIAWAYFSRVDEVAVAQGELIPFAQVRPVRSLGGGTIQQVYAREGKSVKKGDVLLDVEPEKTKVIDADIARLEKSSKLIQDDLNRLEAERSGNGSAGTAIQDEFLNARLKAFDEQKAGAEAEANQQVAAIGEARTRLSRLEENLINAQENLKNARKNLENANEQERGLRTLLTDRAVPRLEYIRAKDNVTNAEDKVVSAQDKVVSTQKELAGQLDRIRQSEQGYQAAKSKADGLASQRQSEILTTLTKRKEEIASMKGQLDQSRKQRELSKITAPVDGTVYSVKATRGPVQQGEELLSILPKGEEVVLEVKVLNRDIGFIQAGQRVKVKMATFPFQEFGIVEGTVMKVSPNAIVEKDQNGQSQGPVFPTRIQLNKQAIDVNGKKVELTPGMSASGEIVTRKKSVLTFLIEPVTRRFSEAFQVR
ncbi:HlyD family type I secretion periplasmic adaptor subunit [Phormidium sp. CLA17]|uniref:HlyD family type I secretion periplasmic adaptor subunit n=1 Tax=Leptolyngbya sp. Cla-17 TaxID=2803751 RepID=UPI00149173E7|nr:HlyD family type I secretion periplasmic adaptor subunit [Leptolyngbya sp. Cla-17]MBM0742629.1 HlyD family type I secretion periplasmic adaptor subunit [Leptolyngbya sp. Cla-17]